MFPSMNTCRMICVLVYMDDYLCNGIFHGLTVIVVENGHSDPSSNHVYISHGAKTLGKSMILIILPSAIGKYKG